MLRNILSVIAGLITAWILFKGIQLINFLIVPKPEGFDMAVPGSMKQFIDFLPFYAWVILILGYLIGSFAAGLVIGKIAESKTRFLPVVAAIVFIFGWLGNVLTYPHPVWVVISVFLVYVPGVLAGHRIALKRAS